MSAIRRAYLPGRYGQLHYRHAGTDASGRRPLVLLHQNPASSFEYEPLIAAMATDRRVIALDTPGYGMSDGPDAPLSMAGYAESFAAALAALDIDAATGCDVYGFHTGALLALETALAAPDLVRHVVLTGLPMRAPEERRERLEAAQAAPAIDEDGTVALGMASALWDYVVARRTPGTALDRAAALWIDKLRALDRSQWAYHGVWSYDFEGRLPLVRQPVLLIQPHEEIFPQSIAAVALVPDHRLVELPDYRRDIFDQPPAIAEMAAAMRHFLDSAHPLPGVSA